MIAYTCPECDKSWTVEDDPEEWAYGHDCEDEDEVTYKIVRFTFDNNHPDYHKVIKTGLTLDEAQEHCNDEDTREEGVFFDGYEEE